jgi:2-polyprenyl-6-methoxyphenol hydroxylase-like FAD-dependent oxidoreductase
MAARIRCAGRPGVASIRGAGAMNTRHAILGHHAVVIGAGVAGLASAGALRDSFGRVTVLELDALSPTPKHRIGTPQDRHTHALLYGGLEALDELFPGFAEDLAHAGAVPQRVGYDVRYERPGFDSFPRRDFGWRSFCMTRPLIERTLRARVERCANVNLRGRCRVRAITAATNGDSVCGVEFEHDARRETLAADFVVDASGRGDPTFALLESLGKPPPRETRVGVDLGYSSALFEIPDNARQDWKTVLCFPKAPESSRSGIIMQVEGNCWNVTLGGRFGDKPPGDPNGFMDFARDLRTPTIADASGPAKPASPVFRFGTPTCMRRDFSSVGGFPQRLIPLGDAICRFNPAYGQGMSVAAQQARMLRRLLATAEADSRLFAGLSQTFFSEVQTLIDAPWSMTTVLDFAYPQTQGHRPPDIEQRRQFGLALVRLAVDDPAVHKLMLSVQHLLAPQSVYRDPALVERVLAVIAGKNAAADARPLLAAGAAPAGHSSNANSSYGEPQ